MALSSINYGLFDVITAGRSFSIVSIKKFVLKLSDL